MIKRIFLITALMLFGVSFGYAGDNVTVLDGTERIQGVPNESYLTGDFPVSGPQQTALDLKADLDGADFSGAIQVDTISEHTDGVGVTVETVLIKDGKATIPGKHFDNNVFIGEAQVEHENDDMADGQAAWAQPAIVVFNGTYSDVTGTNEGTTTLIDTTNTPFGDIDSLIGFVVWNTTDDTCASITANTSSAVTNDGGNGSQCTGITWDNGDAYHIPSKNYHAKWSDTLVSPYSSPLHLPVADYTKLEVKDNYQGPITSSATDAVAHWVKTKVFTDTTRRTWANHIIMEIAADSGYTGTAIGEEINYHNLNLSHNQGGGTLHLAGGSSSQGEQAFNLLVTGSQVGTDILSNTSSAAGTANGHFIWFGPTSGNYPTGTPNFAIDADGNVGILATPNAELTIAGEISLAEQTSPTDDSGYGKLFNNTSNGLPYWRTAAGVEYNLTVDPAGHTQNTDTGTDSDDFSIGDGTDTDKTITVDNGDSNEPQLLYDSGTSAWQYSNDGVTYVPIGTGGGSGTVLTGVANALSGYVDTDAEVSPTDGSGTDGVFWNDTTKYLGVGTNTPSSVLVIQGTVTGVANPEGVSISPSVNNTTSGTTYGIVNTPTLQSNIAASYMIGDFTRPYFIPGANVTEVEGVSISPQIQESSFDIDKFYAAIVGGKVSNTGAGYSGDIGEVSMLYLKALTNQGTGAAIPVYKQLEIGILPAATLAYPIYSVDTDDSSFIAGGLEIGGTARSAPKIVLQADGDIEATGSILGGINIISKSANYILGTDKASETRGSKIYATAPMILTITAAEGDSGCFENEQGDTSVIQLKPAAGDYLVSQGIRGTIATAYASSGALGDKICWTCRDATDCYIESEVGTWAEL